MGRENENKRVFGDNPVTRLRSESYGGQARQNQEGQARMNTFEKLTALKQPERRDISSRILATPEAIVRKHRAQVLRWEDKRPGPIVGRPSKPLPWRRRIDWNFVNSMIALGCAITLGLVGVYMLFQVVIPFVTMLRWQ